MLLHCAMSDRSKLLHSGILTLSWRRSLSYRNMIGFSVIKELNREVRDTLVALITPHHFGYIRIILILRYFISIFYLKAVTMTNFNLFQTNFFSPYPLNLHPQRFLFIFYLLFHVVWRVKTRTIKTGLYSLDLHDSLKLEAYDLLQINVTAEGI